jgi:hypothetical protein
MILKKVTNREFTVGLSPFALRKIPYFRGAKDDTSAAIDRSAAGTQPTRKPGAGEFPVVMPG